MHEGGGRQVLHLWECEAEARLNMILEGPKCVCGASRGGGGDEGHGPSMWRWNQPTSWKGLTGLFGPLWRPVACWAGSRGF